MIMAYQQQQESEYMVAIQINEIENTIDVNQAYSIEEQIIAAKRASTAAKDLINSLLEEQALETENAEKDENPAITTVDAGSRLA